MPDPLEQVLRLVSDGRLTAAEAAPILDALAAANAVTDDPAPGPADPAEPGVPGEPGDRVQGRAPSSIRIEVKENGRQVVNLRIPVSLRPVRRRPDPRPVGVRRGPRPLGAGRRPAREPPRRRRGGRRRRPDRPRMTSTRPR